MTQHDAFDSVLALLHEAMLDDAGWPAASALIDEVCGAISNSLVVGQGRSQQDGEIHMVRFCRGGERDTDWEQWYFNNYYPIDEFVPRVAQLPDSQLVHVTDLYTTRELKTSPVYNDARRRIRHQNGLCVRLDGPDGSSIAWSLGDSTIPGGWWSDQTAMIERLLPHVRQFIRVRQALAGAEALGASLATLLENTCVGVVHLDRRGQIIELNDRARDLLHRRDGLFDQDGLLHARLPTSDARLQHLVTGALPAFRSRGVGGSMTVERSLGVPGLVVHVHPVGQRENDFDTPRVAVLVLVVDTGRPPVVDPELVAETLGLTPAESQVAVSLAAGFSVRDIASTTGRQENSIRFLLKQVYNKQGISRQADLVRLVLSLTPAFFHPRR